MLSPRTRSRAGPNSAMHPSEGLPPLANPAARVLILGSMPGVASLKQRQYYAHPRNQFWDFIEHLFGIDRGLPYAERCRLLSAAGVAVWDVIGRCLRCGSLDTRIVSSSIVANDVATFVARHRRLRCIFFNGLKSEQTYARHVSAEVEKLGRRLAYRRLPSTSPAHASLSAAEKLRSWRIVAKRASVTPGALV